MARTKWTALKMPHMPDDEQAQAAPSNTVRAPDKGVKKTARKSAPGASAPRRVRVERAQALLDSSLECSIPPRRKKETTAMPPTAKKKKAQKAVVYSSSGYPADGFHAYQQPERRTHSTHSTLAAANKAARKLFYRENPYGLEDEELDNHGVNESELAGCCTFYMCPEDSEFWKVGVEPVG